ncbi:MAG: L-aspartate oxidase [Gammaproteobacteria bacterium]|jgi:L-aspartate oxidase|nr:L-aspartate oxidase [Gammaproteobacteria bacterium]MBT3724036.1 L-aspartate oxidase [Gammaproteobacteria bacterium]MBT4194372.1 L-aspartate oxidase [Gammaproteobacteria bacterium]MBT4451201.1 L-aspartate oxidase [Gammaproteobacteria bacterium]MBT4859306.1 L-aspartate oxidase [Gammaproteobacteria bacterium]
MSKQFHYDVIIIGAGAAGMTLALQLPDNISIALLAKDNYKQCSTYYAQGGISAVLEQDDSFDLHSTDTQNAGSGICDDKTVKMVAESGPAVIHWLADLGMPFTKDRQDVTASGFHLTREGGHSRRRVVHAADATGKAMQKTLQAHVAEKQNIDVFEHTIAIDLITKKDICVGLYAYNIRNHQVNAFAAKKVVLATGGASKVYLYTSNPDGSTGDGIAMAWRAGCRVANMEFIQFHPTCLFHPEAKSFLITEALRGEGAKLLLPNGKRFMQHFDERAELAPRDIVARAIDHEMKRLGAECVYLDISHKSRAFIKSHFPTIYEKCKQFDIDITRQPIPVVPAAHYTCGGVMIDLDGQTDIQNLYAIGEISYSGLHGANRMASNSLLECMTFAMASARHIKETLDSTKKPGRLKNWDESLVTDSDEEVVVSHNWDELRRFMWDYVGIVRTNKRLERALNRTNLLKREINDYYGNFRVTPDLLELRNLVAVAELIIRSALSRQESRGLHYTLDFPQISDNPEVTILTPNKKPDKQSQKISLISS